MRSKELRYIQENHATLKPGSSVAPRVKTYTELRNLQILKKMLEKSIFVIRLGRCVKYSRS